MAARRAGGEGEDVVAAESEAVVARESALVSRLLVEEAVCGRCGVETARGRLAGARSVAAMARERQGAAGGGEFRATRRACVRA
jgi:hypothetical protein